MLFVKYFDNIYTHSYVLTMKLYENRNIKYYQ